MDVSILCGVLVFFFKQKTAYEMRISDWSSDVCSSDLRRQSLDDLACAVRGAIVHGDDFEDVAGPIESAEEAGDGVSHDLLFVVAGHDERDVGRSEERRVGKSVSVRVDLGG